MKQAFSWAIVAMFLFRSIAFTQIPVEVFGGNKKSTLDLMFFKFFKNKAGNSSRFLFFNRNRASIDYRMTQTSQLPLFGFTEAFSYNHEKLKGFAPVCVVSILNRGMYPKTGVQFAKVKKDLTLFSWLVVETLKHPTIDFFFLGRYTPKLTEECQLFTQMETVNAFPTAQKSFFNFSQRLRLGIQRKNMQMGLGLDLNQLGKNDFIKTENYGVFLRYEF